MERRLKGTLRRTGLVAAAAATALLASAGVASAAARGAATAYGPEVYGSANWQWTTTGWTDGNAAVRDTLCDGKNAYVHFEVRFNGVVVPTKDRKDPDGCDPTDGYWSGLTYDAGYYVGAVRVVTCIDGGRCYYSPWQDNPLT
ncbi:hypothetical protein [Kitasatospora cheerisanensis]|uniref:Secreted protein n=1 Tax=Kitasatospora cheerisanensis KCTC 2395 TaxID=1348663 RepID=A0A066Z9L8_9ACTN|nr:hypothetical protein [Kitasatospora cheerisanensis]KDN86855.1 hypothetical protein KCH_13010 [Kitasatospora cheerisanensis KCTC 2395]